MWWYDWRYCPVMRCCLVFLRLAHRARLPLVESALLASSFTLAALYCLQATGVLTRRDQPQGWDIRRWPLKERNFFQRSAVLLAILTAVLVLAALLR